MVLSILIAAIVAPGLLGSQEAIRQSQSKEKREEHRARRCNLIATCVKSSHRSREIDGRQVVLRNGKLWIDTGTEDGSPLGHPYAGYYLPYPDTNHEGLVTTITDVAPIMNWVYVDKETGEVKYGVRADAQPNLTGPFDCTRQDRRLTFDGWEGWCAVEEAPGLWGLYFDLGDDGLKSRVAPGTRVLEIELSRKEKRFQKEPRTLDSTSKPNVGPAEISGMGQIKSSPGIGGSLPSVTTEPLPTEAQSTSGEESEVILKQEDVARTQPASSLIDDKKSTPEKADSPPAEQQSPSVSEKRITPKLNRSSGSRAIAQAQKFEALAAAQKPDSNVRRRSNERGSRANSTTSSVYSNEGESLSTPGASVQPQASPTPAPLALAISKANQAKALAARSQPSDPSIQRPITPPRQRAPSLRQDPAISGAQTTASSKPIISLPRRPNPSRSSPSPSATSQRSTSRQATQTSSQNRQQRERSISGLG